MLLLRLVAVAIKMCKMKVRAIYMRGMGAKERWSRRIENRQ